MTIYIRFENDKQVETTTLENKPEGIGWHEAPESFDWQKSYCLTEGGEIAERSEKDIEDELLQNAKFSVLSNLDIYFNNYTNQYTGNSHQKAKSYEIQEKAAENILVAEEANQPLHSKDTEIIEPLAKIRGISVIEMAKLIQDKAKKAVKVVAKCEELEDLAKKRIKEAKTKEELQNFLKHFEQEIENSLANL
ncbi:hypothetical protein [Wolbachia endosymbiont of Folsomia candida]|uniref:hypothetical protein n=1 Tax=Wolbachia endosymbiont of Folsomia candida TaxID=169402 RepID=UPI000AE9268C|nr:hypothetical protein [Wolbachia endosymbiont of Folsomia candida]APR97820.1 hypothetical protein ASM33_00515 [Wolbachia endosymbiont of Folsomia candida]APR99020.1 hypothetical protein ASM33_07495 [Wolbachia endosymbiont of Folsomia candida]